MSKPLILIMACAIWTWEEEPTYKEKKTRIWKLALVAEEMLFAYQGD